MAQCALRCVAAALMSLLVWGIGACLQVWHAMNFAVAAIREQEAALGMPAHIVAVQGTRGWARSLAYYMTHPITAGQGLNVVYETHPCE